MTRRRALLSLLLSFAVGVQAAHGAPVRATRLLRALHCCAVRCPAHHPVSEAGARRCCGIAPTDIDSAAKAPATATDLAPMSALVTALSSAPHFGPAIVDDSSSTTTARAGPVFLLSRSLRL